MGAPKQRPLLDRHIHTLALRSFGKLLKHPTSKDNVGYLNHRLLAMVSIGYPLCPIGAVVVSGYGLYGLCVLWLPARGDLGEGCAVSTFFMGISNCCERPCVAQALRSTVNWLLVRRNAVGAAS